MRFILLLSLVLCLPGLSFSQTPSLDWAYQMAPTATHQYSSITSDANGDIYVIGSYLGTIDLDPGPAVMNTTSTSPDFYLQKLDPAGNLIWAKTYGGVGGEFVYDIDIDIFGNIFISGSYTLTTDLDPGLGVEALTAVGQRDLFVLKLNPTGDFIWAKSFGSSTWTYGFSCDTDAAGNVFVSGQFEYTVDFDPGIGVYNLTSNGDADIFVFKLDSNGDFVWAHSEGSIDYDASLELVVDNSQNVLLTGRYDWTVDFDPGPLVYNLTVTLFGNCFIQKLDNDGNFIWAKTLEGGTAGANSIIVDDTNNVYVTGWYRDSIDLDPNVGIANFNSFTSTADDMFALKLDSLGIFSWGWSGGGVLFDAGYSIDVDNLGNTYVTGANDHAIYILKLDQNANMVWDTYLGNAGGNFGKDIHAANDGSVYVVGQFGGSIDLDPGPLTSSFTSLGIYDNFVLKLDSCINNSSVENVVTCDSYTWIDGNTYTSSNNSATWTLSNSQGCDSVITLDLTITNSTSTVDTHTACDSFTWIDGNTYTSSINTPTWSLTNAQGCDSLITLDLTINSVDATTTQTNATTLSANTSGATYQWLDCDNSNAQLVGAVSQTYVAIANGNYSVEVSLNGCVDTSSCNLINQVGYSENSFGPNLLVSPNPTSGKLKINLGQEYPQITVSVFNAIGQKLSTKDFYSTQIIDMRIQGESGLYIIEVQAEMMKAKVVVVKN
ncbi:MAG: T9SS type A sorting domain-containing protein [Crocinitomicaceae bacterium]|nr:T9SS type A sorting domain-containing protein [Flavobacteriales bacterium]NQZ38069.1 T9SS type A sorting domain-containing protein [Crocinitomicaceae bacterium]